MKAYHGAEPYTRAEADNQPWSSATHVGLSLPPGTVALDIDVKNAKQGDSHLRGLEAGLGKLPQTAKQDTPSGGWHLAFTCRSLPEYQALGGRVISIDGRPLDIDIVHSGYRFLTVYEPDVWMEDADSWNELPTTYHDAVVRRQRTWADIPRMTGGFVPANCELPSLIRVVELSREGERNNTLFLCTALAVSQGFITKRELALLAQAGRASGLGAEEVDVTIASAVRVAEHRNCQVEVWEVTALRDPHQVGTGSFEGFGRVVGAVGDVARIHPRDPIFGLSVRDLALRSGLVRNTANKHVRNLRGSGLLSVENGNPLSIARRYSLRIPAESSEWLPVDWDSPASRGELLLATDGLSQPATAFERMRAAHRRRVSRLLRHSAFMRSRHGLSLTPSKGAILMALEMDIDDEHRMAALTSLSGPTVVRHLDRLIKAGLVEGDLESETFALTRPAAALTVEAWTRGHAIPKRAEKRRATYESESRIFAARLLERERPAEIRPGDGRVGTSADGQGSLKRPFGRRRGDRGD